MSNLTLIKKNENLLMLQGQIEYWKRCSKNIEVDGEIYTKNWSEEKTSTIDDIRKEYDGSYFYTHDYDFDLIGYSVEIEDSNFLTTELSSKLSNYVGSTNSKVCALSEAMDLNLLDKRILSIEYGKGGDYCRRDWSWQFKNIIKTMIIHIPLFRYGFNNSVGYSISLETLFDCPKEKIPIDIVEMFKANGINLMSKNKLNEVGKLITKKTQLCSQ